MLESTYLFSLGIDFIQLSPRWRPVKMDEIFSGWFSLNKKTDASQIKLLANSFKFCLSMQIGDEKFYTY